MSLNTSRSWLLVLAVILTCLPVIVDLIVLGISWKTDPNSETPKTWRFRIKVAGAVVPAGCYTRIPDCRRNPALRRRTQQHSRYSTLDGDRKSSPTHGTPPAGNSPGSTNRHALAFPAPPWYILPHEQLTLEARRHSRPQASPGAISGPVGQGSQSTKGGRVAVGDGTL